MLNDDSHTMKHPINALWAVIATRPDGNEGIPAIMTGPLITGDEKVAAELFPKVMEANQSDSVKMRVVKFVRQEIQ